MYIADIVLNLIIFIFQKIILPILPVNLGGFTLIEFHDFLFDTLEHNLAWSLSGMNAFFRVQLIFILIGIIISTELGYWLIKGGMWLAKIIRG